ncbi:PhzF family phenazine biosynthesis isomerase [Bacillus sp. FJAT-49732]|uniref:PhzF family phenazine biosynthesis isomerase n=1 Tax=Lederbergia citrisecunda TaxID=2833583 RepID=A0A942TNW9_9BACI|nr:PhzF family phenazine biosynthesis isomerase [Lederbergia citrisecunda]MBS4201735.1 PhzF family phenazine biosynthesis isomerase [Lederbergia citrisecunda]
MPKVCVKHIDAFSSIPGKGNPAGVVLNGGDYTDEQMLAIAAAVGFNETSFVVSSNIADFRIRYFTPGHEMNLCGHATMGTVYALRMNGLLKQSDFTIETNAGVLPIHIHEENNQLLITMQQAKPQFQTFNGSKSEIAASIGLTEEDLHSQYPIVYGSTGIWTLIVPVKELASFHNMDPATKDFPGILKEMRRASVHPISFEVRDEGNDMHARHFSSPFSGTVEDAVTGTASGVMGAYYKTFVNEDMSLPTTFIVEQGHEMEKDGRVYVHVNGEHGNLEISISGTAVYVKDIEVEIE